jgi:hypothetical protein
MRENGTLSEPTAFNLELALAFLGLGRSEKALPAIRARLENNPPTAELRLALGDYRHLQQCDPELAGLAEALALLERALQGFAFESPMC